MAFCDDNPIYDFEMANMPKEWIFDSDLREEKQIKTPEISGQRPELYLEELYLEELFSILGV